MMSRTVFRNFDVFLFLITIALIAIGGVMIYSSYEASLPKGGLLESTVIRQMVVALAGLVFYLVLTVLDYHLLLSLYRWLYILILGMLALTLLAGQTSFGAQSWLGSHGGLQPSELAKVLTIIVLARFLGREHEALEGIGPLLISLVAIVPPVLLIYRQPDLGTALILVAIWVGMVFLSGVRWRHILLLGGAAIVAVPFVWLGLKGYMRERILTFVFPGRDPSGASYNITQALISIGSGGLWGKGLLHGTQSQLYFLRVRHTDFVFSVLAEELGFVGSILFLGLYALLILRLVRIALRARDASGRLIVAGVATMLLTQTFINLAMNANLLPVTGLPLPLVSYGGSSLLTTLLALGLVQSVAMRRRAPESEPLM